MKLEFILTIVFLIFETFLFAQNRYDKTDRRPQNNINLNLYGDGSIVSINYERLFLFESTSFLTSKLGLGYNREFQFCWGSCSSSPEEYITIPHHFTVNSGGKRHFFEIGLGGTIIIGNTKLNYIPYPIIGYRIQPLKKYNFDFRIFGCLPLSGWIILNINDILFMPFGLSLGISF